MKMKNHKKTKLNTKESRNPAASYINNLKIEEVYGGGNNKNLEEKQTLHNNHPATANSNQEETTQKLDNTNKNTNTDTNEVVVEDLTKDVLDNATSKIEEVITKDIKQHSEQIVNICIKSMDHVSQNNHFATNILNNLFTNWNLIADDLWAIYANYIDKSISCKSSEDYLNTNLNFINSLFGVTKQVNLVHSQIALDCLNELIMPSIKQTSGSMEGLKKCYS